MYSVRRRRWGMEDGKDAEEEDARGCKDGTFEVEGTEMMATSDEDELA